MLHVHQCYKTCFKNHQNTQSFIIQYVTDNRQQATAAWKSFCDFCFCDSNEIWNEWYLWTGSGWHRRVKKQGWKYFCKVPVSVLNVQKKFAMLRLNVHLIAEFSYEFNSMCLCQCRVQDDLMKCYKFGFEQRAPPPSWISCWITFFWLWELWKTR